MADYPKRDKFFSHRFVRILHKSCASLDMGHAATLLCVFIAHTEDAARYSGPVRFWNSQLDETMGFRSRKQLNDARQKAVDAGWLVYEREHDRSVGRYFVTIPERFADLSDAPMESASVPNSEQETEQETESVPNSEHKAGRKTEQERHTSGSANDTLLGAPSIPIPSPSPIPKDTHSLTSEESTFHVNAGTVRPPQPLRLPQHADTQRNRDQLEAWQTVRQATHGQRTNAVAWDAEATLHASWTEATWFDSLQFSTSKASKGLLDPASDFQKKRSGGGSHRNPEPTYPKLRPIDEC